MPQFQTPVTKDLEHLGLTGDSATVFQDGDNLALSCADGSQVRIPFTRLAKVRCAFTESRGGSDHYLRIWVDDEGKSLHLSGRGDRWNYCDFVWALTPALIAHRPAITVQTGDSYFTPIFLITAIGGMFLATACGTIWMLLTGDDWTVFLGAMAVAGVILAIVGPWTILRYWPRKITNPRDIRRALLGFKPPD